MRGLRFVKPDFADLVDVMGQVDAGRAALEPVLHLGTGVLVEHRLHHGELVQVGVEQGLDDRHEADYAPGRVNRGGRGHARLSAWVDPRHAWMQVRPYNDLRNRRGTSIRACPQIAAHTATRTGSERCLASNF